MRIININLLDIVELLTWLLSCFGLWKFFEKFHIEGWWAFIPGARIYWLGRCAERENDGKVAMICELLLFPFGVAIAILDSGLSFYSFLELISLFLLLTALIYKARICIDLCGDLKVSKHWAWLWVFFESLAALIWGLSSHFSPKSALTRYNGDDPLLPSELNKAFFECAQSSDDGLSVKIKDRTVRNFLDRRYLLRDIFMNIEPGHMVLLLGGSGAGKTTFINAVTGYEKANAEILLDGMNVYDEYDKMKYTIGFTTNEVMNERVNSVLEQFGLTSVKHSLVEKLSGGQRKRLSIAMEYISDPYLFVLDEPDSGLDGVIARDLMRRLRKIADEGKIIIVITHTPDRVAYLFDDLIVLAKDSRKTGRLAYYGSIEDAKEFFGTDTMEGILKLINQKDEGGEGKSDEFVRKYAERQVAAE